MTILLIIELYILMSFRFFHTLQLNNLLFKLFFLNADWMILFFLLNDQIKLMEHLGLVFSCIYKKKRPLVFSIVLFGLY